MAATRKAINSWHDDLNTWDLLPVSSITATKLLRGEFKTFDELQNAPFNPNSSTIEILYRKIKNTNREQFIYIIETIFINE